MYNIKSPLLPAPPGGGHSPLFEQLADGVEQRWKVLESQPSEGTLQPSGGTLQPWAYEWLAPPCAHALLLLLLAALLAPGAQHKRASQLLQRAATLLETHHSAHPEDGHALVLRVLVQQARVSLLLCTSRVAQAQGLLVEVFKLVEGREGLGMLRPGMHMLCGMCVSGGGVVGGGWG